MVGLRGLEADNALLLEAKSVHGIGLNRAFRAVGIDPERRVIGSKLVNPGGFAFFRTGRWILEMPVDRVAPRIGTVLTWGGG